jgi:subtilisin family serine protease
MIVVGCLSEEDGFGNLNQYALWEQYVDEELKGTNVGVNGVDLFAPGAAVISTYIGNPGYAFDSGTSMAAPLVTV